MNGFVEMQPKWSSSVVGAVPVCRPARPARAHPSLGASGEGRKHNVCTWKCIIRGWKRRCADVRAGTQAPPLPFQTRASKLRARNQKVFCSQKRCKHQTVRECVCRNAASAKPFGNSFAEMLQAPNHSGIHLQKCCKRQTIREFICRNAANAKPFGNAFAEMLQAPNRSGIHLQKCCKRQTVREFICRNAANAKPFGNSFAGTLRAFEKVE